MTKHLENAIAEMRSLPEREQEAISQFILDVIAERKFDRLLESEASLRLLERMADEALEADRRGETIDVEDLCR
jgi:hypothetical protein